jgi:peptidyl-prolyl cis-trans isomerase A (cyclophilin A)
MMPYPIPDSLAGTGTPKGAVLADARFHTTMGTFTVRLMPEHAPKTVRNFTELATGKREWRDPLDGRKKSDPLYDGTRFHRVISDFMIQGGDPEGTGRGGPGYQFEDECPPEGPSFDRPGLMAMANAGPNTNGSQYFVTLAPTKWLTGLHTIFGEVTEGMEVVEAISQIDTDPSDRPVKEVTVERIEIVD